MQCDNLHWARYALPSLLLMLFIGQGCTMVDGNAVYRVDGRLVSSSGEKTNPLDGRKVVVRPVDRPFRPDLDIEESSPIYPGYVVTGDGGAFVSEIAGPRWGYTLFLGFIPVSGSTTPPVPDKLDEVVLYYRKHDGVGGWQSVTVHVPDNQQVQAKPGERWVHLGVVRVPEEP